MKFFNSKSERKFARANRGIAQYVEMYKKAVDAAEAELTGLSAKLSAKVDKYDAKIEAAYSKYMRVEDKYNDKLSKLEVSTESRRAELEVISAQARKAVENHNAIYLGK